MSYTPQGFYGRLARWAILNKLAVIGILVAVSALAGFFASKVKVDSDILHLMPEDEPSTQALAQLDAEEGGVNVLTIAAEADDAAARDAFMSDLQGRMEALPETDYVLYQLDEETTFKLGLLQLPVEDLATVRDRVKAALTLGPTLANPFVAARVLDLGPITEKLSAGGSDLKLVSKSGVARMMVRPKGSAHDIPFARAFMGKVYKELDAAKAAHPTAKVLWIGGAYRHNVEDYESILKDIVWTTGASLGLVLVIIAGAFRTPRALAIIFVPLLLSNLWTVGVAGATVGGLNTFTSFVNAVLIGLGVEFGVHLYARVRELIDEGEALEDAVVRAWDLVGGACTSACLTAAAGFAALLAAHFAGFRQLGWLLSLGLLLTLVAELVLMPVLVMWLEKAVARPPVKRGRVFGRKFPAVYRLAPMTLTLLAGFTVVAALFVRDVQFEYDLSELRRSGLAWADLTEKEQQLAAESYAPLVVSYPDEAALDEAYHRLKAKVDSGKLPEVASVISVRTILPRDQTERVEVLKEIAALTADPMVAFLPLAVRNNLQKVADAGPHEVQASELPRSVQHVLGALDGKHRLLLVPAGNMWDMRDAYHLTETMEKELPGQVVASEYVTLGVLFRLMKRDAPIIAGVAFMLVLAFTWLDLRKLRPTAGAMAVLVAGVAWWAALLVMADIKLSMVNFVGIPIVLGIGIDVMIHLIHRMEEEGPGGIIKSLATTGWASALGTSTTVVAFAALSLGSSQGIRSLGLLVLLGEVAVTVAGFVLVPLGFATKWSLRGQHPPGDDEEE
ncbi:MAG: MMPL family transporter [Deltaproteobacteria bacterium]|nr:MMPL family transporter [Deltaproteobacteria bacterium]